MEICKHYIQLRHITTIIPGFCVMSTHFQRGDSPNCFECQDINATSPKSYPDE